MFLFMLKTTMWWEYVESNANWADGVSRKEGKHCRWAAAHGFSVVQVEGPKVMAQSVSEVVASLRAMDGIGLVAESAFGKMCRALEEHEETEEDTSS